MQLIFDRSITKATPGPFRTRVITDGVIPSLHIDYKGTRIKQYHKEGQALTHDSILAEETLQQLQRPRTVEGQRVSALRFADPTVQALWNAVLMFDLLPAGFSNSQLRMHLAQLLGQAAETLTPGCMSYHLRRLRLHGTDRAHSENSSLPPLLHASLRQDSARRLGMVLPAASPVPSSLLRSFDHLTKEIHCWVDPAKMAA